LRIARGEPHNQVFRRLQVRYVLHASVTSGTRFWGQFSGIAQWIDVSTGSSGEEGRCRPLIYFSIYRDEILRLASKQGP
jgi:hypothetical protein